MALLPHGEKISKICLFVLTELTNVTDRQTDKRTDRQTPHAGIYRAYAWHRAVKNHRIFTKFCTQQQILNWMNVT